MHNPVHALAASPTFAKDGICFAAHTAGLARSVDGGRTWRDAYTALDLQAALTTAAVAVSPDFAADRTLFAGAVGGVLRSHDGGETWTVAALPPPPPFVTALAVSPNYASTAWSLRAPWKTASCARGIGAPAGRRGTSACSI